MSGWTSHTGTAIAYAQDGIDTDQIIPARFMSTPRSEGYGNFLFHDLRDDTFPLIRHPDTSILIAGANFGSGSSREAAVYALVDFGIRAVIAKSFERIHRSNLIGMGVLPLEFADGEGAEELGLNGHETFDIAGIQEMVAADFEGGRTLEVVAKGESGSKTFQVKVRLDTPQEVAYYHHGGILPYVLRQLL